MVKQESLERKRRKSEGERDRDSEQRESREIYCKRNRLGAEVGGLLGEKFDQSSSKRE